MSEMRNPKQLPDDHDDEAMSSQASAKEDPTVDKLMFLSLRDTWKVISLASSTIITQVETSIQQVVARMSGQT